MCIVLCMILHCMCKKKDENYQSDNYEDFEGLEDEKSNDVELIDKHNYENEAFEVYFKSDQNKNLSLVNAKLEWH